MADISAIQALLSAPFRDDDIEWRVLECGIAKSKPWAHLAPYIDSRAIMRRLDEAVGCNNWYDSYHEVNTPKGIALMCKLSIRIGDEWITKEDGCDFSRGIEHTKSAISDAIKRAAVKFGVGRDLYDAPTIWARDIVEGFAPRGRTDTISIRSKTHSITAWCPAPAFSKYSAQRPNVMEEEDDDTDQSPQASAAQATVQREKSEKVSHLKEVVANNAAASRQNPSMGMATTQQKQTLTRLIGEREMSAPERTSRLNEMEKLSFESAGVKIEAIQKLPKRSSTAVN